MKLNNNKQTRHDQALDLPMTSMIDVVFLLLIFFLVTTSFINPERHLKSSLLVEAIVVGSNDSTLEPAVVELYNSGGQVVFKMGAVHSNDLLEIERIMSSFTNKSDGAFVQVGSEIPFEFSARVIAAFKANGFTNVSYLPGQQQ